jgi:hypothetical protein
MTVVGVLGSPRRAEVDGRGGVTVPSGLRVEWIVGADDHWHVASADVAVRQRRLGPAPAVETAMHIPGGDALHRVYGVGGRGDLVVLEVENASPVPFVLGLVVWGGREFRVAVEGGVVVIDGAPAIVGARGPARWTAGAVGAATTVAMGGEATDAALTDVRAREVVLLWPVTHRTVTRLALTLEPDVDRREIVAPVGLPSIDDVVAGWKAQLARGMRVELPDDALQSTVDAARVDALLAAAVTTRPDARLLTALEDWGFDAEAAAAWARAGWRARRTARARRSRPGDVDVLAEVRNALVSERGNVLEAVPVLRPEWRGASLDVRDAPTRVGRLSYSVRWHGKHPALLWEVAGPAAAVIVRAPALDPDWSTTEPSGEALLRFAPSAWR